MSKDASASERILTSTRSGTGLALSIAACPSLAHAAALLPDSEWPWLGLAFCLLSGLALGYAFGRRSRIATGTPPEQPLASVEEQAAPPLGEGLYLDMLESVSEVIFRTDARGRLVYLNSVWRKLSGHGIRNSLGKPLHEFLHPDDREAAARLFRDLMAGIGAGGEHEFRLRTRSGEIRWIEVSAHRAPDSEPGESGLTGTVDDISARKVAELSLRNLNQELEARVRLRTAELEASNRELEAFSYSVSHDLRAPLRAIDGFARILEEELEGRIEAHTLGHLSRIRKASERMAKLIDALINLALLTRQPLRKESFSLSELARQIVEELHAEQPGREIMVEITEGLEVTADRALIFSMLDNLLRNAWKFTAQRSPAQISLSAERINGRRVFCIADNGVGFDMNHSGNLFRPFYRLHANEAFPGTGIGLATVQRIVQRHDGSIWAESRPGEGTRFLFTLGQ